MTDDSTEAKVMAYAAEFLRAYGAALSENFAAEAREISNCGLARRYFPLYGRQVGRDVGLVLLSTDNDFYLFFVDEPGVGLKEWRQAGPEDGFDRDWTFKTPDEKRAKRVQAHLGLSDDRVLGLVNVPGTNFIAFTAQAMLQDAPHHGSGHANRDGGMAETALPSLRKAFEGEQVRAGFRAAYETLLAWTSTPQARGIAFEKLWRDVLAHHRWHPKKVTIAGEDDDFTAIYKGLHILGEVRWYAEPMTGGKAREFLAKLDPRPTTIGLFISLSGFDDGAHAVIRRAVNSKTIVMFDKPQIDAVLRDGADPGELFDEKLRDVYDSLFETPRAI